MSIFKGRLYNIVGDISLRPDSIFGTIITNKVEDILKQRYDVKIDFCLDMLKSDLYKAYYNMNKQEAMLDSVIYFYQKVIYLCHQNNMGEIYEYHVTQGYLAIAEYMLLKKEHDIAYINECLNIARESRDKDDAYIKSTLNYIEALILYKQKRYKEAEKKIIAAEDSLKQKLKLNAIFRELPDNEIKQA